MTSERLSKSGFVSTSMNGNNLCQLAKPCQTINKSLVKFLKGSVLRPLLFLLYIKDFNNSSNELDFHSFADDSNLFFYANMRLLDLETL